VKSPAVQNQQVAEKSCVGKRRKGQKDGSTIVCVKLGGGKSYSRGSKESVSKGKIGKKIIKSVALFEKINSI